MELKELQKKAVLVALSYGKRYDVKIDQDYAMLKLYEEVGEFSNAVLIHQKRCRPEKFVPEDVSKKMLADELADIVGMALLNAHLNGIDIEEAMDRKWINRERQKNI